MGAWRGVSKVLPDKFRIIHDTIALAARRGLVHLDAEDETLDGRHVTVRGRRQISFGSCSYVGLETDRRLKESACDAVRRFGVQFACSRAYISSPL
jgi:7-keto-8-aminopelargonate synthetase-like enzyme